MLGVEVAHAAQGRKVLWKRFIAVAGAAIGRKQPVEIPIVVASSPPARVHSLTHHAVICASIDRGNPRCGCNRGYLCKHRAR